MSRLRVLLSAYQCAPGEGSVSQIGWEWYSRMARYASVTLVTHIRNQPVLSLQPAVADDAEIIYIDTEALAGPLYGLSSRLFPRSQHAVFLISSLDFFAFDRKAVHALRQMQSGGRRWDVAHCVTPVSPLASPTLHRLGIPTALGPWNGGLKSPDTFPEVMARDSGWMYSIRNLARIAEYFNHGIAHSSLILSATAATRASISTRYLPKVVSMLENGVDLDRFHAAPWPAPPSLENPLRIVFVGRLLPSKGVPMLLDAIHKLSSSIHLELTIIGEGSERPALEAQSASLGLTRSVKFLGNQSLATVAEGMRAAHVFCLPSVRESGGAVVLEAMASARPVIAVSYGGPAEILSEDVGQPILPIGREHVVERLCAGLMSVCKEPEIWRQKGIAGRKRAEREFSWDAKVKEGVRLYQSLINNRQEPDHDPVPGKACAAAQFSTTTRTIR